MRFKLVVLVIGGLILAQIVVYNLIMDNNNGVLLRGITQTTETIQQLKKEKAELSNKFNDLRQVIKTIPPSVLMGFEDPETGFVEFLDFLQVPAMREVEGQFSLKEAQKFKSTPVPLHSSTFNFQFKFLNTYETEKFLNFLLRQERFPLQVQSLKLTRGRGGKSQGELGIALLIPAKLQLTSLSAGDEG